MRLKVWRVKCRIGKSSKRNHPFSLIITARNANSAEKKTGKLLKTKKLVILDTCQTYGIQLKDK